MNEKLNIQDLIDMLAEKHGMDKQHADGFVKAFFQLIEESLGKDKYVKIKGLGTFKLIDVGSRESVNVNTGERFEIQGHTKLSFTPEPALKNIINRPFSHFETVVLNDATVLEDTLQEDDCEEEEDAESAILKKVAEKEGRPFVEERVAADVKEEAATDEVAAEKIEAEEVSTEILKEPEPEAAEAEPEPELPEAVAVPKTVVPDEPEAPEQPAVKETADSFAMKYFVGVVLLVALLCGGAVAFMYYPDWSEKAMPAPFAEEIENSDADNLAAEKTNLPETKGNAWPDSIVPQDAVELPVKSDTVAETVAATASVEKEIPQKSASSQASVPKKEKKKASVPFEPDSVGYTIAGTETTYTLKEGETLTRVALRFYGTKALWPYIVKHNPDVIKDPDNVPYGTTIKIPKLVKRQ